MKNLAQTFSQEFHMNKTLKCSSTTHSLVFTQTKFNQSSSKNLKHKDFEKIQEKIIEELLLDRNNFFLSSKRFLVPKYFIFNVEKKSTILATTFDHDL
jgi:hypothetical protein